MVNAILIINLENKSTVSPILLFEHMPISKNDLSIYIPTYRYIRTLMIKMVCIPSLLGAFRGLICFATSRISLSDTSIVSVPTSAFNRSLDSGIS